MCCDGLACARCTGPVAEGRCPVCRAARAELHGGPALPLPVVALLVAVLLTLALLARSVG